MLEFSYDWFSPNIPALAEHLRELRDRPVYALEIGCYEGRATIWLLDNILVHPDSAITCIDTFEGSDEHRELGIDFTGTYERFRRNTQGRPVGTCVGTSHDWLRRLTGPFNLVYIDGSHLAADVLLDACLVWSLVAEGGIIVFDDYEWNRYPEPWRNPKLAIDSFLGCMDGRIRLLHRGYQVIVRKT